MFQIELIIGFEQLLKNKKVQKEGGNPKQKKEVFS